MEFSSDKKPFLLELVQIKETMLETQIAKEINLRKSRLGADPLPILKIKVEEEFYMLSDLDVDYERLVGLENSETLKLDTIEKYLHFLSKKLPHVEKSLKDICSEKVLTFSSELLSNGRFSLLAISHILEAQNIPLRLRTADFLAQFETQILESREPYASIIQSFLLFRKPKEDSYLDALQLVRQGLEAVPGSVLGNALLCQILVLCDDASEAILAAEVAITKIKKAEDSFGWVLTTVVTEVQLILADCYSLLDYTAQALVTYKSVIEIEAHSFNAWMGLGKLYTSLLKLTDARECFSNVLKIDAGHLEATSELGWICFLENDYPKALQLLNGVLELGETGKTYYRIARIYWEMGGEHRTNKDYTHAHLIKAIKLDSKMSDSFTFLGHYYRDLDNDLTRATKCYSKAISINPRDSDAVRSITDIWIKQGKVPDVVELLNQFLKFMPRSNWGWKQLGIVSIVILFE